MNHASNASAAAGRDVAVNGDLVSVQVVQEKSSCLTRHERAGLNRKVEAIASASGGARDDRKRLAAEIWKTLHEYARVDKVDYIEALYLPSLHAILDLKKEISDLRKAALSGEEQALIEDFRASSGEGRAMIGALAAACKNYSQRG